MTEQDFDYIRALVREHSAIVLEPGKEYLVDTRLTPLVRQLKLGSISELVQRLRAPGANGLCTRVVEAMVTTETSFFRDLHPYESLRRSVLPELIARRRGERRLAIWSAACSTGQEPYSVAILLREHFPELAGWDVRLLATDLSAEVLGRAREGRFNQIEVNRGLPAAVLVKYFTQHHGQTWQLSEAIRGMVEFRELNLARPWPPLPAMDLILLRNVMIYFDVPTRKTVLSRAGALLRPEGYLLLGSAETTLNLDDSFRRVEQVRGGFYQRSGR
jgi:chemotaxis protein methyltransferase CheR